MPPVQKDNTTDPQKITLRRTLLQALKRLGVEPVILETHGGIGTLYSAVYNRVPGGVVFEHDPAKAQYLARQRPCWAVYEANAAHALLEGVGGHVCATVLDVDPYGDPWPTISAYFEGEHPRAPILGVVVNDGLRHKARIGGAWKATTLEDHVLRYGNQKVYEEYLEIAEQLMHEKAAQAGYRLDRFSGYYCGQWEMMTHYAAILRLTPAAAGRVESAAPGSAGRAAHKNDAA